MKISSTSEDENTEESDVLDSSDAQLEIVTECWVEPQAGVVGNSPEERAFFQGLDYNALAESVSYISFYYFQWNASFSVAKSSGVFFTCPFFFPE